MLDQELYLIEFDLKENIKNKIQSYHNKVKNTNC